MIHARHPDVELANGRGRLHFSALRLPRRGLLVVQAIVRLALPTQRSLSAGKGRCKVASQTPTRALCRGRVKTQRNPLPQALLMHAQGRHAVRRKSTAQCSKAVVSAAGFSPRSHRNRHRQDSGDWRLKPLRYDKQRANTASKNIEHERHTGPERE